MIKYIKYIIKGILIGIAKIIPGVSGAVLAISLGVYDLGIDAITHFFNNIKKNILFLGSIATGCIIGIISFSKIINYLINNYYLIIMLLFTGLVLGGSININKCIKKDKVTYIIMTLSILLILTLGISNINNIYIVKNSLIDYIIYFLAGIMEAIGTIIPGISSTALLMIMGIYNLFIEVIANITNLHYFLSHITFILSFGIGFVISTIIISLIMDYLFKYHKDKTYAFIIGISIGSVILMLLKSLIIPFKIEELIIGAILFIFGLFSSYYS
jgi:putative membrane protein